LVAGSLLSFSALAFRTAFDDPTGRGVTAAAPETSGGKPVVLPRVASRGSSGAKVADNTPSRPADQVLGKRISRSSVPAPASAPARHPRTHLAATQPVATDTHTGHSRHGNGHGHEKARGEGHHKDHHDAWDSQSPPRDENDSWDDDHEDHGDRSDDSDHSDEDHHDHEHEGGEHDD
jgi:hypothetical protein